MQTFQKQELQLAVSLYQHALHTMLDFPCYQTGLGSPQKTIESFRKGHPRSSDQARDELRELPPVDQ